MHDYPSLCITQCCYRNILLYRTGWLTLGPSLSSSNFHKETYHSFFDGGENSFLLSQVDEIENLRPKTPPPKGRGASRGGGVSAGLGRGTMIGRGYPV